MYITGKPYKLMYDVMKLDKYVNYNWRNGVTTEPGITFGNV